MAAVGGILLYTDSISVPLYFFLYMENFSVLVYTFKPFFPFSCKLSPLYCTLNFRFFYLNLRFFLFSPKGIARK